ncbi:hypothetical protein RJ641_002923 [Dillenia turbinata]|uniref:Uncharacterized protein n=1 Tax=Dillenia turbinata TaxID=194707 RepID=A0AAN8VBK5_9MAGN
MGSNEPFGTSWADQWDYNPDPVPETKKNETGKYSKKIGEGVDKSKSAASTGVKKVKQGASVGFNWIKDKCHKTPQKN